MPVVVQQSGQGGGAVIDFARHGGIEPELAAQLVVMGVDET
ncbi:MAG: hypothetical protein WBG76_16340 [Ornithinimicrobium sp.]